MWGLVTNLPFRKSGETVDIHYPNAGSVRYFDHAHEPELGDGSAHRFNRQTQEIADVSTAHGQVHDVIDAVTVFG